MVCKISSNSNSNNSKEKGYIFKNKVLGESQINSEITKNRDQKKPILESAHLQQYFPPQGFQFPVFSLWPYKNDNKIQLLKNIHASYLLLSEGKHQSWDVLKKSQCGFVQLVTWGNRKMFCSCWIVYEKWFYFLWLLKSRETQFAQWLFLVARLWTS